MFPVTLKFLKTHDAAVLPAANHKDPYTGDSGLDVTAVFDVNIPAQHYAIVQVGLKLAYITPGYWFKVESRSGLGFKHHLMAHPGIIDNPYRGDLGVKIYNNGYEDYRVKAGDKVAQFVIYPLIQASTEWATEISVTERGEKGFGSSDLQSKRI